MTRTIQQRVNASRAYTLKHSLCKRLYILLGFLLFVFLSGGMFITYTLNVHPTTLKYRPMKNANYRQYLTLMQTVSSHLIVSICIVTLNFFPFALFTSMRHLCRPAEEEIPRRGETHKVPAALVKLHLLLTLDTLCLFAMVVLSQASASARVFTSHSLKSPCPEL